MIFILGAHGFVGSAFVDQCHQQGHEHVGISRDNYQAYVGSECQVFINANGNSRKYLAETDPLADFDMNVRATLRSLLDFKAGLYVYLSSSDVYNDVSDPARNGEDTTIDPSSLSRYGFGKYLGELAVRKYAPKWLIIRMGGLLGPGLKKNPVYDMLHGRPLRVHPESSYQYIDTRDLARIVLDLAFRGVSKEVFNVAGAGVIRLSDILRMLGQVSQENSLERQHYEISTDKISVRCHVPETADTVRSFLQTVQQSNHKRSVVP